MNSLISTLVALFLVACSGPPQTASSQAKLGDQAMSGIPALEGAAALVGRWELAGPHGACTLLLSADGARLEAGSLAAPMHSLVIEGDCGELPEIAGWRPIPPMQRRRASQAQRK